MKRLMIFIVASIAIFAASINMYGGYEIPTGPNYYCVYSILEERCFVGVGTACYGIDEYCEWLDEEEQSEDN